MARAAVLVLVDVQGSLAPAIEKTRGEADDDEGDRHLGCLHDALGQVAVEEDDRHPEGEQRGRMPQAPGEPELRGSSAGTLPSPGDQRGDCGEVVGIARVAQPEQDRSQEHDPDGGAGGELRDLVVEAEHA